MERSHLVIVMENDHRESLQTEFPNSQNKVILLTELVGETMSNVPDPVVDKNFDPVEITEMISRILDEGFLKLVALAKNNGHKN